MNCILALVGRLKELYNNAFVITVSQQDAPDVLVRCIASNNIMTHIQKYVRPNDLVGIKGSLKNDVDGSLVVFCNKFTCLAGTKETYEEGGE